MCVSECHSIVMALGRSLILYSSDEMTDYSLMAGFVSTAVWADGNRMCYYCTVVKQTKTMIVSEKR
jgi:hypothetical protein